MHYAFVLSMFLTALTVTPSDAVDAPFISTSSSGDLIMNVFEQQLLLARSSHDNPSIISTDTVLGSSDLQALLSAVVTPLASTIAAMNATIAAMNATMTATITAMNATIADLRAEQTRAQAVESSIAVAANVQSYPGMTLSNPATSCLALLQLGKNYTQMYAQTSGVYYIRYSDGSVQQVYCDQTSYGGGWELVMKLGQSTTFSYNSTYWTAVNTLNSTSSLDATFGSDNKYNGYNYGIYTQVLVRFYYSGTYWDWPITTMNGAQTPLAYFTQPAIYFGNPVSTGYFTNGGTKWSRQAGYQNFGVNDCCGFGTLSSGSDCVRFGFTWNDQNDCSSSDASGGLGLSSSFRNYSVGDVSVCCGSVGVNTWMNAQMWFRRY